MHGPLDGLSATASHTKNKHSLLHPTAKRYLNNICNSAPQQHWQFRQGTQTQGDTDTLQIQQPVHNAIWFPQSQHFSTPEIHRQLIELYGDDVMRVQRVSKWCRYKMAVRTSAVTIAAVGRTDEWRNWLRKPDESKFETYSLHCTKIRKRNWLFVNGRNCKSLMSRPQNIEIRAEVGQLHRCALGICWRIIILQGNKWDTGKVVMTSHLIFVTQTALLVEHPMHRTQTPELSKWCITEPRYYVLSKLLQTPKATYYPNYSRPPSAMYFPNYCRHQLLRIIQITVDSHF